VLSQGAIRERVARLGLDARRLDGLRLLLLALPPGLGLLHRLEEPLLLRLQELLARRELRVRLRRGGPGHRGPRVSGAVERRDVEDVVAREGDGGVPAGPAR